MSSLDPSATPEVRHIMGMPIGIDLRDGRGVDVEVAFAWLREVDATFSTYRSDSEISRLDRGELTLADCRPEVDEVLTRCLALERETGGFFSARPAGRLDPSGLVKGWAVGRAADRLAAAGARSFCINAGGDVVAHGRPAPDRLWRVGIRHPEEADGLAAVLAVEDLAVATSGTYERGAHIVDPHTGGPPAGLLSVTVVGPDLGTADAYATAAFAMGAAGPAWTATLDGYDAMCVTSDRRVLTTAGFARHRDAIVAAVTTADPADDGLDRLSAQELHDLAVSRAKHHLDVRFFWDLIQVLPAAEAAAGELDDAESDVLSLSAHVDDVTDSGRGEVGELLRPFYLEYLRAHDVQAPEASA